MLRCLTLRTEKTGNRLVYNRRKASNVIRIDMDDIPPLRAGRGQGSLDILKRSLDLAHDRIRDFEFIIPSALAGDLNAITNLERL